MRYVPLAVSALKLVLWFVFCIGLVVLLGGSFLLGLVISSGVAFVVLMGKTIETKPAMTSPPRPPPPPPPPRRR